MCHVIHQFAGEGAQVLHLGGILGRDDKTKVVPIVLAARGKSLTICAVTIAVEQAALASFAVNAVALEIGQMPGERGCAKVCALLADHPRFDDHPALGLGSAHGQRGTAAAP